MQRTIRLQLNTSPQQTQVLRQTLDEFTVVFNYVCNYGWLNSLTNGVKLHHATYYPLKELVKLPTQLICAARVKATEALKSAFTRKKNGRKTGQPRSNLCPVRYDQRSYWVNWSDQTASLATEEGRQLVKFTVPTYAAKYTGYSVDSADLLYRKGKFWLHVVVTLPTPPQNENPNPDTTEVIGVDLGIAHPAVTSKRRFLGKKHWKEVERRTFRLRRALQSKGTRSAKKHLRKLRGRQIRFQRDCDHVLSKRLVQSATPGATIVIEDLTKIRSHARQSKGAGQRRLHSWTFAQFRSFLTYKAEEAGMQVVAVDPRYTSQTCSRCSYQHRSNRKSQSQFLCKKCAYQLNADLNAAYNIRDKHLATLGKTLGSGLQSISLACQASSSQGA